MTPDASSPSSFPKAVVCGHTGTTASDWPRWRARRHQRSNARPSMRSLHGPAASAPEPASEPERDSKIVALLRSGSFFAAPAHRGPHSDYSRHDRTEGIRGGCRRADRDSRVSARAAARRRSRRTAHRRASEHTAPSASSESSRARRMRSIRACPAPPSKPA